MVFDICINKSIEKTIKKRLDLKQPSIIITTMINVSKKPFEDVVGQESVKRLLSFYLNAFKVTSMVPNFLFVAEKGTGKTMFCTEVAKNLLIDGKPKRAKEINCSTLGQGQAGINQFVEQIAIPFIQDNDCTLVFDEASELPEGLTMSLLTMLNPNSDNRNTFVTPDGSILDIDFRRHTFMFATTCPHKIFPALMSRLKRVDLESYTDDQLMTIVEKNITKNSKVTFANDGVKQEIPKVLRNNPRCGQMMANDIITYAAHSKIKVFSMKDWEKLKVQINILPYGLNSTELRVLQFLNDNGNRGVRLADISAKLGMSAGAIQRDIETFMLRTNLMCVDGGRKITKKGQKIIQEIGKNI